MTQLMNESVSDGGDCRTAPATPGLLKMYDELMAKTKNKPIFLQAVLGPFLAKMASSETILLLLFLYRKIMVLY